MYTQNCVISLLRYHQFNLKLKLKVFAVKAIHRMSIRECDLLH